MRVPPRPYAPLTPRPLPEVEGAFARSGSSEWHLQFLAEPRIGQRGANRLVRFEHLDAEFFGQHLRQRRTCRELARIDLVPQHQLDAVPQRDSLARLPFPQRGPIEVHMVSLTFSKGVPLWARHSQPSTAPRRAVRCAPLRPSKERKQNLSPRRRAAAARSTRWGPLWGK